MATWQAFAPDTADLGDILAPDRTALLIVDIQNDFGHPDGLASKFGANLSTVDPAVDAAERLVDAAHAVKAPVIFIALKTSFARDSRPAIERRARMGQPYAEEKRLCRDGTWGSDWYRLHPAEQDHIMPKWRYSSFQGTGLDLQLKSLGVNTVVVTGLTTECCVETAVRDAFHLDYSVFVAEDACASYDPALHEGSVRTMSIHHALILKADQVAQAWAGRVQS